jgi:hypothetical protein
VLLGCGLLCAAMPYGWYRVVFYARARTEERHLSADPTYVAYARWISEHGLLRRLGRFLPFARYE